MKIVALEEHFAFPDVIEAWRQSARQQSTNVFYCPRQSAIQTLADSPVGGRSRALETSGLPAVLQKCTDKEVT